MELISDIYHSFALFMGERGAWWYGVVCHSVVCVHIACQLLCGNFLSLVHGTLVRVITGIGNVFKVEGRAW